MCITFRKRVKNNTFQTSKKRRSSITENSDIVLNHFFLKKLSQGEVLY